MKQEFKSFHVKVNRKKLFKKFDSDFLRNKLKNALTVKQDLPKRLNARTNSIPNRNLFLLYVRETDGVVNERRNIFCTRILSPNNKIEYFWELRSDSMMDFEDVKQLICHKDYFIPWIWFSKKSNFQNRLNSLPETIFPIFKGLTPISHSSMFFLLLFSLNTSINNYCFLYDWFFSLILLLYFFFYKICLYGQSICESKRREKKKERKKNKRKEC